MAKMLHDELTRGKPKRNRKRLADTHIPDFDQTGLRQVDIARTPNSTQSHGKSVGTGRDPAQPNRVPVTGRSQRLEPPLDRPLNLPSGPSATYGYDNLGATAAPPRYIDSSPHAGDEPQPLTPDSIVQAIPAARTEISMGTDRFPAPPNNWPHGRHFQEAGVPGTGIFSGFISASTTGEFNPDMYGWNALRIYDQMRRTDADVAAALFAMKLPILSVFPEIVPGETNGGGDGNLAQEIAGFVRECLFGGLERENPAYPNTWVSQSFQEVRENAFLMLDFGCAAHENLWRVDGNHIRPRFLAPRMPYTFYRFWTAEDGETLTGLEQLGYRRERYVSTTIPSRDLCLFVNRKEGSNFWGLSALRAAYSHWYIKSQLYRIDAIALERNGMGVPWIKFPAGAKSEDVIKAQGWVEEMAVSERTGIATPDGYDFNMVGLRGRIRDPINSIKHHPLPLDTRVPTPSGFSTMGELKVGDEVFDECGRIQRVKAKTEVYQSRPCYRLHFSDGSSIVADAEHFWPTRTFYERRDSRAGGLRTTKEIYDTCLQRIVGGREISNHSIDACQPVEYPQKDLPIAPYVLGTWLGDGSSHSGQICCHAKDVDEQEQILTAFGCETKRLGKQNEAVLLRVHGLTVALEKLDVLRDKHIPEIYLRASVEQRRELLAGLLDTDGCATNDGRAVFTNTNKNLVDGVAELARSLGEIVTVRGPIRFKNPSWKPFWEVGFVPQGCPFLLVRKANKILSKASSLKQKRHRHYIVSVESVKPQDTVCITVDGPSHLFLVGNYLPTSNSQEIVRSVMAMFIALGTTETGSRALANTLLDLFRQSLQHYAAVFCYCMNNFTIRPLVDLNYSSRNGHRLPYPYLIFPSIVVIDPVETAEVLNKLGNAQVDIVRPSVELEKAVLQKFGLPYGPARTKFAPTLTQVRIMAQPAGEETVQEIGRSQAPVEEQKPLLVPKGAQDIPPEPPNMGKVVPIPSQSQPQSGEIPLRGNPVDIHDMVNQLVAGRHGTGVHESGKPLPSKPPHSYKFTDTLNFRGIPVFVEQERGEIRSGTNADGTTWQTEMKRPYGYIQGVLGLDQEEMDCFIGPYKKAKQVYVVRTRVPDTGEGDEEKVMLGFRSSSEAKNVFLQHYDDPAFFRSIRSMTLPRFKEWLQALGGQVQLSAAATNGHRPEIGMDLDDTLAEPVRPFDPNKVGDPIPSAVEKVRRLEKMGYKVWIFTARPNLRPVIEWSLHHGLDLPVTNEKRPGFIAIIDNRAIPASASVGETVSEVKDLTRR